MNGWFFMVFIVGIILTNRPMDASINQSTGCLEQRSIEAKEASNTLDSVLTGGESKGGGKLGGCVGLFLCLPRQPRQVKYHFFCRQRETAGFRG